MSENSGMASLHPAWGRCAGTILRLIHDHVRLAGRHDCDSHQGASGCRAVEVLIERMSDPDPRVRSAAARGLCYYETAESLAAVEAALCGDPIPYVRRAALDCVEHGESEQKYALFAAALFDADWSVRARATSIIRQSDDPELYDMVAPQLRAPDELTRWRAAFALQFWDADEVRAVLLEATRARRWQYRRKAAAGIAMHANEAVVLCLMNLAENDPALEVQIEAVFSLGVRLTEPIVAFLQKLCCDARSRVSGVAATMLGFDRSHEILDWLVSRVSAPDGVTRRNAHRVGRLPGVFRRRENPGPAAGWVDGGVRGVLPLVCEDDLNKARWLLQYKRRLPPAEYQLQMEATFWQACHARRLPAVLWLIDEAPEAREWLNSGLNQIGRMGLWHLAVFIVDYVDQEGLLDVFAPARQLLRYAFQQDLRWVVEWLLGLQATRGPAQWGAWTNGVFATACEEKRFWAVSLLLSLPAARCWIDPASRGQAAFEKAALTCWPIADLLFVSDEDPPMIQFARVYPQAFEQACAQEDEGMLRWLIKNAEAGGDTRVTAELQLIEERRLEEEKAGELPSELQHWWELKMKASGGPAAAAEARLIDDNIFQEALALEGIPSLFKRMSAAFREQHWTATFQRACRSRNREALCRLFR